MLREMIAYHSGAGALKSFPLGGSWQNRLFGTDFA